MTLLLLHGSAIEASRKKLTEIRKKFNSDSTMVFEEKGDLQQILTNLQSQSLFDDERLIILENPPEDFSNYTLNAIPYTLVLWFDHEVASAKPIIKLVKQAKGDILCFAEEREVSIFLLLDYLATKDRKAFVEVEKLKKAGFDIQYFITMIFYLLRNLITTPKNAPQFVKDKLQRQRKNISLEKATKLYKDILEIDFKIKSGFLEKDQAEFLLVNQFLKD